MTWTSALGQLDRTDPVEFCIHLVDAKDGPPKWRRHKGPAGFRFRSVRAALFSADMGARAACLAYSSYAHSGYSAGTHAIVPYVGIWSQGAEEAFLVRTGAGDPEVTVVPSASLDRVRDCPHDELLTVLAGVFATGAEAHGVRLLGSTAVYEDE